MLACAMLCYAVLWHAMLCHASYAEEPEGAPRNRQGHAEEPVKDAAKEPELRGTGQGTRGIGLGIPGPFHQSLCTEEVGTPKASLIGEK